MKSILLKIVIPLFVISGCAARRSLVTSNHSSDTTQEFEQLINSTWDPKLIPGLAVSVVTSEEIKHLYVNGIRRIGFKDSISRQDYFHLGSNTKAFTAMAIAKLVEKGALNWDTKITDVYPGWSNKMHKDYQNVTLLDLLSHRAGTPPFTDTDEMEDMPQFSGSASEVREQFSLWLLKIKPIPIGAKEKARYSNAGYVVAASMLEHIAGHSWEELIEGLLQELGISGKFDWPAYNDSNQPWGHYSAENNALVAHDPNGEYHIGEILAPSGDLSMNIESYSKFIQVNLQGLKGEQTVIKAETMEFLHYANIGKSIYSLGWGSGKAGGYTISSHNGSGGTFYCTVKLYKEADLGICIMANVDTEQAVEKIRKISSDLASLYLDKK